MKRFKITRIAISAVLLMAFSACSGREEEAENRFTADFDEEISVSFILPSDFSMGENGEDAPKIPGEFEKRITLYNPRGDAVGYVGYSHYTEQEELPPEDEYYKAVWPGMRLSSMFTWAEFTEVADITGGKRGTADIIYVENPRENTGRLAGAPHRQAQGVLSYNRDIKVYAGFAFYEDTLTRRQLEDLCKSIEISSK